MRSFEYGGYLETPLSHTLLMAMRSLGEYKGRQMLYTDQFPEVLETLRRAAVVQSTESSNRIEGITVAPGRMDELVLKKAKPRDRSEQEVAGYRDVLASIHTNHASLQLTEKLMLDWHRALYRFTDERSGAWKSADNAILEVTPDGSRVVRFRPVSALATLTSARGAKREMVRAAVDRLATHFTIGDLKRACPGVSYPTLQRALADLRKEKKVRCLGRGPDASWERIGG